MLRTKWLIKVTTRYRGRTNNHKPYRPYTIAVPIRFLYYLKKLPNYDYILRFLHSFHSLWLRASAIRQS